MCFVEGCLVKKDNMIWVVKGIVHPRGYLTVLPRYVIRDEDTGNDGNIIKKIGLKNPEEYYRAIITNTNYGKPVYNKCAGRATPLMRISEVEKFYDPFKPVVCEEKRDSEPCLVHEYLSSAIEHGKVGLTGSSYFGWTPQNDIDVIIFTKPNDIAEVITEIKRRTSEISWKDALSIMIARQYLLQNLTMLTRIKNSISQRRVLGNNVFIRILTVNPFTYSECQYSILKEGEARLHGIVIEEESFVYPYTYKVRVLSSVFLEKNQEIIIISDRGRFSEAACKGDEVKIKGDYEAKIYSPSRIEHHVYLWSQHHYIVPIKTS